MRKNERIAQSAKHRGSLDITSCVKRSVPWVSFVVFVLTTASGCSYFKAHLTSAELSKRYQYNHDRALEKLVDIAMVRGYEAVNGDGQARQVLELLNSGAGSIHRQFFEVQPRGEGLLDVFFLENKGSVNESELSRFPRYLRLSIQEFLQGLPQARSTEYRPLRVGQQKLSRQMIVYQTTNGEGVVQFTQNVIAIEKNKLYGLYHLPDGSFVFFGKESEEVFRKDYLEADSRYKELVRKFLEFFRPEFRL